MTNSVDPDETARHEPSHRDLHFLHIHLFWTERGKYCYLWANNAKKENNTATM